MWSGPDIMWSAPVSIRSGPDNNLLKKKKKKKKKKLMSVVGHGNKIGSFQIAMFKNCTFKVNCFLFIYFYDITTCFVEIRLQCVGRYRWGR